MNMRLLAVLPVSVASLLSAPAGFAQNLVENGSFEAGIDHRLAMGRWMVAGVPSLSLDRSTRVHGEVSLKIPYSRYAHVIGDRKVTGAVIRSTMPMRLAAGQRYTFAVSVRGERPTRGRLVLTPNGPAGYKQKPVAEKEILIPSDWARVGLTYEAPEEQHLYWEIHAEADAPGHLWIDALQMAPGWPSEFAPARTLEAALTSDRLGRIFAPGEAPRVVLMAANAGAAPLEQRFAIEVFDLDGTKVWSETVTRSVPARGRIEHAVEIPVTRRGIYRAVLTLPGAAADQPEGELTFSVLPEPRKIDPEHSAFGAYLTIAPEPLAIMRRIGFHWIANLTANVRMIYWKHVEPKEGQFQWYDEDIEQAAAAGFRVMFNLEPCHPPGWARGLPVAEQREKWARYVKAMVRHYGRSVKYWTISDEAHDVRQKSYKRACWTDEEEYAAWHKAGYDAIKSVDPDAKVIMNVWPGFADRLLDKLDPGTVDILAANAYHVPLPYLARMNAVAAKHGIERRWAPGITLTPHNFYVRHYEPGQALKYGLPGRSWSEINGRLLRAVVTTFALGYERLFHYTATYVGNTNHPSLYEADSGLKPYAAQLAALAWLLDGFTRAAPVAAPYPAQRLQVYRFDKRDGTGMFVLWGMAQAQRLHLGEVSGAGVALYDQFTNPMPLSEAEGRLELRFGVEPVFLEVPVSRAEAVARAFHEARHTIDSPPR